MGCRCVKWGVQTKSQTVCGKWGGRGHKQPMMMTDRSVFPLTTSGMGMGMGMGVGMGVRMGVGRGMHRGMCSVITFYSKASVQWA